MSKYQITKPVDFGPWTIGDKNYGPGCPSCKVPLNNYAPKVGDTVEGDIITGNYYTFSNNQKHLKTGRGVLFPIYTNGAASTQGQSTIQFITEDHLALVVPPTPPTEPQEPVQNEPPAVEDPNNTTPYHPGQTACWLCENGGAMLIGLLIFIGLVFILNQD